MKSYRTRRQDGFTLIEALIALVVMAFGILALAGMQIMLSRNADVAKQRSEATRLAQARMEILRSYTTLNTTTGRLAWADVTSGTDSAYSSSYSNTTYSRSWTVAGATTDPFRTLAVTISWTDRANNAQSVVLSSIIAQMDPQKIGSLGFPNPANGNKKRPKNRNINIPVPAVDLGQGKSGYQIGSIAVVFSNDSGYVIEKCTGTLNATTYANGTAGCTNYPAYILAGYVSGSIATTAGTPTRPTGVNATAITGWDSSGGKTISCSYAQATDQTTGTALTGYHYYLCVVPVTSGGTWNGTMRLVVPTNSNYKVCRYQYNTSSSVTANQRNVQPYVSVGESIDNQNYYLEASNNGNCPADPTGATFVLHQDCRSAQATSTNCPTAVTGP